MYKDLEARLHDVFWAAEPDADESPLLENFLNKHPGKSLELGCGSGRLLLPLVEKGFDAEGVEISSDMVEILQNEARLKKISPQVHLADISHFEPTLQYNAITIPAFTFQLFSRPHALNILKKLRQIATPSAGLYITIFIPWSEILDELEPDAWHLDKTAGLPEGELAQCRTRHQIDRTSQTLARDHHYTISNTSNEIIEQQHVHQDLQWYLLPELKLMLELSDWNLESFDADFSAGNHDSDASLLTLYASAV